METKVTVTGVDMDAAVKEAAEKLGIDLEEKEEESATPKKEKQPAPKKEAVEEVVEEEPSEEEEEPPEEESEEETPEEEEVEEEPEVKTVPLTRFNEVYGRMRNLERAMEILQKEKTVAPVKKERPKPNFETMDEEAKAQWLLDSVSELVDGKLEAKLGPVLSKSELEAANRDVQETAKRHADYKSYVPLMMDIANRHPSLNAEEVYNLAVAASPAKKTASQKKELLDRAKKAKEKIDTKKKARVEKRSSAREKISEKVEYKGVRDAALAMAEKLGMK